MTNPTTQALTRLLDLPLENLRPVDVADLAAAARELEALDDVLTVHQLADITPARYAAWQAEACELLQTSAHEE